MSIEVVVTKIMTFFYKMRACSPSAAGLCITINSIGLGLVPVALAVKRLVIGLL